MLVLDPQDARGSLSPGCDNTVSPDTSRQRSPASLRSGHTSLCVFDSTNLGC